MRSRIPLTIAAIAVVGIGCLTDDAGATANRAPRARVARGSTRTAPAARRPRQALPLPILLQPVVSTGAVTGLTPTSATFSGTVSTSPWSVGYTFDYGPTPAYGQSSPGAPQAIEATSFAPSSLTQTVVGLQPDTVYHYRLAVLGRFNNLEGAFYGADESFTTPGPSAVATATTTTTAATTKTTSTQTTSTTSTTTTATTVAPAVPSTTPTPVVPAVPAPIVGEAATVGTTSGTVTYTVPGSSLPITLDADSSLPLGAVIDATHGVAEVTNALAGGATQSVSVWDGRFTMTQNRSGRTWFHLVDPPACPTGRIGHAAGHAPVTLWAHDHDGRYGTRGNNSVATVRGTEWGTTESCAGTRTTVRLGVVSVQNLHTGRSVLVHAGHSVLVPR